MVNLVGIIGYPLKHSLSPLFQQAAFDHYGLPFRYQAWEATPKELGAAIARLRHPPYRGANVTIPYKEKVLSLVDEVDGEAKSIGAVNTILRKDGRLVGYNTDAPGFLWALREEGGFDPRGKRAVLLGAGGAARAVGVALLGAGISGLTLCNRTPERAEALVSHLTTIAEQRSWSASIAAIPWEREHLKDALSHSHLVVNCTSVGMKHSPTEGRSPLEAVFIPKGILVYDLVYNPLDTPLLQEAKRAGARPLGGLSMLIYQGALAFQIWTGREAPVAVMMEAAREGLVG